VVIQGAQKNIHSELLACIKDRSKAKLEQISRSTNHRYAQWNTGKQELEQYEAISWSKLKCEERLANDDFLPPMASTRNMLCMKPLSILFLTLEFVSTPAFHLVVGLTYSHKHIEWLDVFVGTLSPQFSHVPVRFAHAPHSWIMIRSVCTTQQQACETYTTASS